MSIKRAVFPVAGLGARFLPATKVIPKEMLPVVDKPIIQYATEEAINAGIKELIFVISETKKSILHHYGDAEVLNQELLEKQKHDLLEIVSDIIPEDIKLNYVEQHKALGLGHAVLCARELVGEEPFAVILPDDMIDDDEHGCLTQMVKIFDDYGSSIIAVENVNPSETDKYGIVSAEAVTANVSSMVDIIEKPDPESAPSTLAVVGRYILTPEIFDLLQNLGKGAGGEIQLTDGIKKLLNIQSVYTYQFHGRRYDCGSKLGYIMAKLNYALKHPEVKDGLLEHLQSRESEG